MNLEDSIGDILRKARTSCQASVEAAANAAGIPLANYQAFETSGHAPGNLRWHALGNLLSLDGLRLQRQHDGWRPSVPSLPRWRELRVVSTTGDDMSVNAFLVWDEVTRDAAAFDTGFDASPILDLIRQNQLTLRHVFITHSHGDHVAGLAALREHHPRARIHSGSPTAPVDQRNRPNECVQLGSLRISHRNTPGHAEDGVTYVVGNWPGDAPHVAIVGDALFAGSIGGAREHLPLARQKIRDEIFSLPPDTLVCPGHGPLSTVGEESANNPWFP
jgi:glyoxylase-like metal-dependent hydrolase (beta-lactamase superfamily II)